MPNRFGLTRFWFEFDLPPSPPPRVGDGVSVDGADWWQPIRRLTYGIGATGWDREDCLRMVQWHLLDGEELPPLKRVIEDVDVRTLDQSHVARNMGVCVWRGIWWPPLWLDPARA